VAPIHVKAPLKGALPQSGGLIKLWLKYEGESEVSVIAKTRVLSFLI